MSWSVIMKLWSWQLICVPQSQWFETLAVEIEFIAKKLICKKISLIKNEIEAWINDWLSKPFYDFHLCLSSSWPFDQILAVCCLQLPDRRTNGNADMTSTSSISIILFQLIWVTTLNKYCNETSSLRELMTKAKRWTFHSYGRNIIWPLRSFSYVHYPLAGKKTASWPETSMIEHLSIYVLC